MNLPKYIILESYKINKDYITFNINPSEYEFYLKWMGISTDEWSKKNYINTGYTKAEQIFIGFKKDDKWNGFIISGVVPSSISVEKDGLHEVSLSYDYYNNVSDDYINKILKHEIRIDKINNLL